MNNQGTENPFRLWRELGEVMTKDCTVIRYNKNLVQTDAKLVELLERFRNVNLSDRTQWANTSVVFTRQLYNMLQLSRVIAQGAAHAGRIAWGTLQAGLPRTRRQEFLKDNESIFCARRG
jgi:succinate dehydrogenase / fumarate reductase, flavoprotein subunit